MKKLFSFCAAMFAVLALNAAVINIDNTTANSLQAALNSAASGDEIVMAAGTYAESGNYLAFTGKDLTVKAAEGAEVIIQTVCPVRLKEGAKAEFVNVKFDCSTIGDYEYVIVAADDTDNKRVVLTGCEFYGWNKNKAMIEATSSRRLASVTINNCYFHNCMKSVVFIENTGSIALSITNSTFANIATDASGFWAGVIDSRATAGSLLVDHCTFYNVLAMNTDYAAIGKVATPGAVVSNSIFMLPAAQDNVRAIRDVASATNCITYNYLKDSGTGIHSSVTKTNCVQVDPAFVDPANGNFTLSATSPALTMNDGQPIGDPRWVPAPAPAHIYSVAGAEALLGSNWNEKEGNEMEVQLDGTYKLVKEGVTLAVGNYEYKVVIDHKWNNGEAANNSVLSITEAGKYDITFTYDAATPATNAQAELKEAIVVLPKVEIAGDFNGWTATEMTPAENKQTASITISIATAADYEFKMIVASNWLANGYTYHRGFPSATGITTNGGNMVLQADVAGDYVFTWTYDTNGISIAFPTATAITNTAVEAKTVKMIENGQMIIIKNGVKYNAIGTVVR